VVQTTPRYVMIGVCVVVYSLKNPGDSYHVLSSATAFVLF